MKHTPTMSLDQSHELTVFAREINARFDASIAIAQKAKGLCNDAVREAILCGDALNLVKSRLPHGQWLPWLARHITGMSKDTAERYMALAKTAHVRNLDNCSGLRQAYITAGILPEPDMAASSEPKPEPDRYVASVSRLDPAKVAAWPPEDRQKLRDAIAPLWQSLQTP